MATHDPAVQENRSGSVPATQAGPTLAATRQRIDRLIGFVELDPGNLGLLCETVDLCLEIGDTRRARSLLERAKAQDQEQPGIRYRMAVLLHQESAAEQSLDITGSLLAEGVQEAAVRLQHAISLVGLERYEEAACLFERLIAERFSHPDMPHLYVRTLQYLSRLEEATAHARAHLKQDPHDCRMRGMLSLILLDQEQFAQADRLAQEVLEQDARNLDALLAAGSMALVMEQGNRARTLFSRAIGCSPWCGRAWAGMGVGLMLEGRLDEATRAMDKTIAFMPAHLGSRIALAWIHILNQENEMGWEVLESALEVNHNFGEIHGTMAVICILRGDWAQAALLSRKALFLQPGSFSGLIAEALAMANEGDMAEARAVIEDMLKTARLPDGGSFVTMIRRFAASEVLSASRRSGHEPQAPTVH